jgi:hypothetical protein
MAENEQDHDAYGPDPGQEAGATTEPAQIGEAPAEVPPPEDLRDTYGNTGPAVGDAVAAGEMGVALPEGGPYPMPTVVERPHTAQRPQTFSAEPNRDPSLSRAVDRAAVGLTPEDAGYDRSIEGPAPGPLDPEAHEDAPDSENQPGGAWGSG